MRLLIQHKIQAGFAVALALLLLTGVTTWWSAQHNAEAFRSVERAYEVHNTLDDTLVEMLNTETGSRGFVISGDEKFLAPYQAGIVAVQKSLAAVKGLTQDDPRLQRRLASLESLIQKKLSHVNEVIKLRRSGDTAGTLQLVAAGQGNQMMDDIRKLIAEMEAEEGQLLQQRTARAQASSRTTMAIVVFGSLLALGLVGFASVIVRRDFEKRQQAEAERDRFFTLSVDLLCIAKTDGYFKRVNPAFTETLGWSVEEMLTRPFLDFVHLDDRAATLREVEKLAAGQPTIHFENRYQCKDGSWKWLSWHTVPQPDGTLYATARDITELKQAEENLRRSEQDFRSMAEAMPQIVWATRPDGWNIFFNQQWVDYTGLTMEESHGHGWNKPFHPDDQQRAWDAWQRATQHNEPYSLECRLRRADGVYRWWLVRGAQMRGANGEVLKWFGTCTDIEESKQAQEALRCSEENLAVTLHSIGDAVLATDAEGRVTRLNPVAEKLTGWTQAEAFGWPVAEVFHIINEETREPAFIPVENVLATGKVQGLANHTVIIARNGTERPIADSAAPIRAKDGQILGVVLVFRDVSEEKKAEQAIRESEALNRAVLNSVMANIAVVDRHGHIIAINEGWERFARENGADATYPSVGVGANYLEVCARAARDVGDEAQEILNGLRGVLAQSQATFRHEYACHSPTEQRWFAMQVSHLDRAEGGAVIAQINITERKRAEAQILQLNESLEQRVHERTAELEAQRGHNELLLNSAGEGLYGLDLDGRVTFMNPVGARILGYSVAELLGQPMHAKCHHTYADGRPFPREECPIYAAKRDGQVHHGSDDVMWRKDGGAVAVEYTSTPLRDAEGQLSGAFVVFRDITERKRTTMLIEQSLREKEVLLKEIHHRVKNNLQVISSLLALQSDAITDANTRGLLMESQNRVRAMAMIHEKLYQSSDLAHVDFGEYVNSLTGFLFRSYSNAAGRVALKVTADDVHLGIDTAVPCGLILNELVSNALKHAFQDGRSGELRVELRAVPDGYSLTVADNGAGLPANFDLKQTNSLGLQLVDTLCKQLKARLAVQSPPGTQFQLFFKDMAGSSR